MHLNELLSTWWIGYGRTLVTTILAMYITSAVGACGLMSFDYVPAGLLVTTFIVPAPIFYLWVSRRGGTITKHWVYHSYWIAGIIWCVVTYFVAVEVPEVALVFALFIVIPALSGYVALLKCEQCWGNGA